MAKSNTYKGGGVVSVSSFLIFNTAIISSACSMKQLGGTPSFLAGMPSPKKNCTVCSVLVPNNSNDNWFRVTVVTSKVNMSGHM